MSPQNDLHFGLCTPFMEAYSMVTHVHPLLLSDTLEQSICVVFSPQTRLPLLRTKCFLDKTTAFVSKNIVLKSHSPHSEQPLQSDCGDWFPIYVVLSREMSSHPVTSMSDLNITAVTPQMHSVTLQLGFCLGYQIMISPLHWHMQALLVRHQ